MNAISETMNTARSRSSESENKTKPTFGVVLFRVAGRSCALAAATVQEIVRIAATTDAPGQPAIVRGFLNLRGAAVPVIPLAGLFGWRTTEAGLNTPLLIAASPAATLGLLVDSAEGVEEFDPSKLSILTETDSFNQCAEGQFLFEGRTVVLLNFDRLLLTQEKQKLASLQAMQQQRIDEAARA